jgi:hypothetical protein
VLLASALVLGPVAASLAPGAAAAEVALQPDPPSSYRVRPGDTLWGIAGRFLREPWRWPEVWEGNPQIADPDRIYPGEVLELDFRADGSPRVRAARDGMRVVKLSPRVRVSEIDAAIPAIPIAAVAPFLSRPIVADADELDDAPYVVGFPSGHVLAGRGDTIFVRRILEASGDGFELLRPGREYRDPDTGEVLGYEASFVAEARLERTGDPATLTVTRSRRAVRAGDRARPAEEERVVRSFLPHPAPAGVEGHIISVLGGVSQIGQYDTVVLDLGERDRIEIGQVLEVYRGGNQRPDRVRRDRRDWNWRNQSPLDVEFWLGDWELTGWRRDQPDADAPLPLHREARRIDDAYIVPEARTGVVMVFRVFPRVSFALVMFAQQAMHIGATVAAPQEG